MTEPRQLRWRAEPAVRRSGSSLIVTGWLAVGEKWPNINALIEVNGQTWQVASWTFSGKQGQPGAIILDLVRPAE
jgi:hypothetical protein